MADYYDSFIPINSKHTYRDSSLMQSDDPYAQALQADGSDLKKKEARALYESSLQYQADMKKYERELADQIMLRDDERAYNSDEAVRQRQIAAGINPDFVAGSGGSSGSSGSVSAPSIASSQQVIPESDSQTFANVAGGVSSIASAVTSAFTGVTGVAQAIKAFPASLRAQDLSNDLAYQEYSQREQINPHTVEAQRLSNDAAAEELDTVRETNKYRKTIAKFQAYRDGIEFAGDISSMLTPSVDSKGIAIPFTREEISSQLRNFGIEDPDGSISDQVLQYSNSPQQQAFYNDQILSSRDSSARVQSSTFDMLNKIHSDELQVRALTASLDRHNTSWSLGVAQLLKTESSARSYANSQKAAIEFDEATNTLDLDKARTDLTVFRSYMDYTKQLINDVDSRINELLNRKPRWGEFSVTLSNHEKAMVNRLLLLKSNLSMLYSNKMSSVLDLANQVYELDYIKSEFLQDGYPQAFDAKFNGHIIRLSNFLFRQGSYGDAQPQDVDVSPAFDLLLSFLSRRGTASSAARFLNQ